MQIQEAVRSDSGLNVRWDVLVTGALLKMEPNWVIQIGAKSKFSALYSATILARIGGKRHFVMSIVENAMGLPRRKNICYLEGKPLDSLVLASIDNLIRPDDKVMVILEDGLKSRPLTEIQTYAPFVTPGGYLILDQEINTFALNYVTFEPDWIMTKPQLYLRKSTSSLGPFDDLPRSQSDQNRLIFSRVPPVPSEREQAPSTPPLPSRRLDR